MSKKKGITRELDLGEKVKEAKKDNLTPNGDQHRPLTWVPPFPASVVGEDGKTETVFVIATSPTDLFVQGVKYPAGQVILPAGVAHAHASILTAPKGN